MNIPKQGVSPLVATVLLFIFAFTIGFIAINWGDVLVPDTLDVTANDIVCSKNVGIIGSDISTREAEGGFEMTFVLYNSKEATVESFYGLVRSGDAMELVHSDRVLRPLDREKFVFMLQSPDLSKALESGNQATLLLYPMVSLQASDSVVNCYGYPIEMVLYKAAMV